MTTTTRPDIVIPKQQWVDIYSVTGITLGSQVTVANKGSNPCLVAVSATQPTDNTEGEPLLIQSKLEIPANSIGLWVYSNNGSTILQVQESSLQKYRQGASWNTTAHPTGMNFETSVALGLITGVRRVAALGNNPDIDTSTYPEDIWSGGGLYPWLTGATQVQLVSTDVNDSAAGTGVRTVLVSGLDVNFVEQSDVVTLNGTTPVVLPKLYYRINSMVLMSAGTNKTNIGTINLTDVSTSTVRAVIPAGKGITRSSGYTVPAGYTLAINSMFVGINKPTAATDATVSTYFGSPNGFFRLPLEISMSGNPYRHDGLPPIIVLEKTDFMLRGSYVSTNNSDITAAWLGMLFQNSVITQP